MGACLYQLSVPIKACNIRRPGDSPSSRERRAVCVHCKLLRSRMLLFVSAMSLFGVPLETCALFVKFARIGWKKFCTTPYIKTRARLRRKATLACCLLRASCNDSSGVPSRDHVVTAEPSRKLRTWVPLHFYCKPHTYYRRVREECVSKHQNYRAGTLVCHSSQPQQ